MGVRPDYRGIEAHYLTGGTPEAWRRVADETPDSAGYTGLRDMTVNEQRRLLRGWPFEEDAHVLRLLLHKLHCWGPDLQNYVAYWKPQAADLTVARAEQNCSNLYGCDIRYGMFVGIDLRAGVRLDDMVTRGLLPGWQRVADALSRRRGSERDHEPASRPAKRRRKRNDLESADPVGFAMAAGAEYDPSLEGALYWTSSSESCDDVEVVAVPAPAAESASTSSAQVFVPGQPPQAPVGGQGA